MARKSCLLTSSVGKAGNGEARRRRKGRVFRCAQHDKGKVVGHTRARLPSGVPGENLPLSGRKSLFCAFSGELGTS
jgi:hypothetical protein